jgi:hypothetical protein
MNNSFKATQKKQSFANQFRVVALKGHLADTGVLNDG